MKIITHVLIRNEENFVWYAINSVIDYVDEVMVWIMKSGDRTEKIVRKIENPKITIKLIDDSKPQNVSLYRQQMLDETKADWIFILDGDEIWWEEGVMQLRMEIEKAGNTKDLVVSPTLMLIGDMYHYQGKKAGRYRIGGKIGHYNIRAVRSGVNGLHIDGIYPNEAFADKNNVKIQDFPRDRILFLDSPYLHMSHLRRSSKDIKKIKYEIGNRFPLDYYYPEVFFRDRPVEVPFVWNSMDIKYKMRAFIETPIKKIKRRLV